MTSQYDPKRDTVGKIYRDAQINHDGTPIIVGDMTHELMMSLVQDLNDTIIQGTKEYDGRPFYIMVHERPDKLMPTAILRRMLKFEKRPYPEDDTVVFFVKHPHANDVRFCWCLPHWSQMDNILNVPELYDNDYVTKIRAWKNMDLYHFGFTKDKMGNWEPNPSYEDEKMETPQRSGPRIIVPC